MDTITKLRESQAADFIFSGTTIFRFLIIAVIIFVILRLTEKVLPLLFNKTSHRIAIRKYFPITEMICWFVFLIWSFQYFLTNNPFYAAGILFIFFVIVIILTWYILKDYIAGAFFKLNRRLQLNDRIKVREFSGKITRLGNRVIEVEAERGETIYIPYSIALTDIIIKSDPAMTAVSHTFQIHTLKKSSLPETINEIRITILQLPWASPRKEPQIKLSSEDDNMYLFDVTVFAVAKEYLTQMEHQVRLKHAIV